MRLGLSVDRASMVGSSRNVCVLASLLSAAAIPGCVITLNTGPSADGGAPGSSSEGGTTTIDDSPDNDAPTGDWVDVTANLANMSSACGNLSNLSAKPDEDLLIAGIALDGLWASRDGDKTWKLFSEAADASTSIVNSTTAIIYDPTKLTRFWENGIHYGAGVYVTNDDGASFTQLGDIQSIDLVSIDFSDPNRQTLLAGQHETPQMVWRSTNGGTTWTNVGLGLPSNSDCDYPLVIDSTTHLVGCDGEGGGPVGVFRTVDGGGTWTQMTSFGGIYPPLVASDGSIYWATPTGGGIGRSTDKGQTWTNVSGGNDVVESITPMELPDGRVVTVGPAYAVPQYVLASKDHGSTWTRVSSAMPNVMPWAVTGIVYSVQRKAFYVWHWTCASVQEVPVPTHGITSYAFDYTKD